MIEYKHVISQDYWFKKELIVSKNLETAQFYIRINISKWNEEDKSWVNENGTILEIPIFLLDTLLKMLQSIKEAI